MSDKRSPARAKRMDGLDLMKALGILMVLSLHVPLWDVDFIVAPTISRAVQYALRLVSEGVPVFVAVNGFLLLGKDGFDLKAHLKKTLRLFILTLMWCAILAVAGMLLARERELFTVRAVLNYIAGTKVNAKYTGVLWYMQNLLAVYLLFPALKLLYDERFDVFKWLFVVVAIFTVGLGTVELVRDVLDLYVGTTLLTRFIAFARRFSPLGDGWYLFYFMLGGMVRANWDAMKKHRVPLAVAGIVSWPWAFYFGFGMSRRLGEVYNPAFNYGSLFMACFVVGLFALTLPYESKGPIGRFAASVGKNTFGIYLSHYLFIFAVARFFTPDTAPERVLAFIVVFAGSYLFTVVVRRIPGLKKLINA